jgi:hypothetical protein
MALAAAGRCVAAAAPLPAAIDFPTAGFGGGGTPLPRPATVTVRPAAGDSTALLPAAIDNLTMTVVTGGVPCTEATPGFLCRATSL